MSWTSSSFTDLLPPQVHLRHPWMILDLLNRSFGQLLSLMHHRDLVRDLPNEAHVVFDDHHRPTPRDVPDELGRLVRLVARHPGRRLIEKEELRIRGEHHTDLEPLLLAM